MADSLQPSEILPTRTSTITLTADGKPACGSRKKSGLRCKQPAGYGTEHPGYGPCKYHLGKTRTPSQRAAQQEMQDRYEEKLRMGEISPDAEPEEVLLQEVARSHAAVDAFDRLVMALEEDEVPTNRGRILINQWNEQRRLLTTVTRIAMAAGIAERQTQVLEIQALGVLHALESVLASPEVDLSPAQQAIARRLLATHLRQITMTDDQRLEMQQVQNGVA